MFVFVNWLGTRGTGGGGSQQIWHDRPHDRQTPGGKERQGDLRSAVCGKVFKVYRKHFVDDHLGALQDYH